MNLALLPNLCALLVIHRHAFRPTAHVAPGRTPTPGFWPGYSFCCITRHLSSAEPARRVTSSSPSLGNGHWSSAAFCFLRAAASDPNTLESFLISAEMALPILAQSALVAFKVHRPLLQTICTLLMIVPGIHLLRLERRRRRPRARMAWGFVISAICLAPFAFFEPEMALSVVHCLLFLGSAALYWDYAADTSTGVFTAVSGLAVWGLVYPIEMVLNHFGITSPLLDAVAQFPSYIVAYGMILTAIY